MTQDPSYVRLMHNCGRDETEPLAGRHECIDAFLAAGLFRTHPSSLPQMNDAVFTSTLLRIVEHSVRASGTVEFGPGQLAESFRTFVESRRAQTHECDLVVPLQGLQIESGPFEFDLAGAPCDLAVFTGREKSELCNRNPDILMPGTPVSVDVVAPAQCRLRAKLLFRGQDADYGPTSEAVEDLITAFRLSRAGGVGATTMWSRPRSFWGRNGDEWIGPPPQTCAVRPDAQPVYILPPDGMEQALTLIAQLRPPSVEGRRRMRDLAFALRRFNLSYSRGFDEDRLLDLVVAMESCLLGADGKAEAGLKFSLRGAAVLARDGGCKQAQGAADRLSAAYAVRSKVVHEGKTLADDAVLKLVRRCVGDGPPELISRRFSQECEDTAREILRRCVAGLQYRTLTELKRDIDRHIKERVAGVLTTE